MKPTNIILESFGRLKVKPMGIISMYTKILHFLWEICYSWKKVKSFLGINIIIYLQIVKEINDISENLLTKENFIRGSQDIFSGVGK